MSSSQTLTAHGRGETLEDALGEAWISTGVEPDDDTATWVEDWSSGACEVTLTYLAPDPGLSPAIDLLQSQLDATRRALCEAYTASTSDLSVEIDGAVHTFHPVAKCWERAMVMWGAAVADGLYPNGARWVEVKS